MSADMENVTTSYLLVATYPLALQDAFPPRDTCLLQRTGLRPTHPVRTEEIPGVTRLSHAHGNEAGEDAGP